LRLLAADPVYEDVVVTYEDGTVETYRFEGCKNGRPLWVLRGFLGFLAGRVAAHRTHKDTCMEVQWAVTRLGEDGYPYPSVPPWDGVDGECVVAATDCCDMTDDLSEVSQWIFLDVDDRRPIEVTGGDFISGGRCCACSTAITSIPVTEVAVGANYEYVVSTSVEDECVYPWIKNQPIWATFKKYFPRWQYQPSAPLARLWGCPECSDLGLQPGIVITVKDDNGDSDSVEFSITVTDETTISNCPDDIFVEKPKDGSPAIATWTEPTWTNVCGIESFTSTHSPGDAFPLGTTTVTYTAEGLVSTATCSFDVVVTLHHADINLDGRVDVLDARLCYQMAVGVLIGTPYERGAADVDDDGDVDMDDAVALAEYVAGMRDTLP